MSDVVLKPFGLSSRFAVLTATASNLLTPPQLESRTKAQEAVLTRACELLDTIIQGSKFVERADTYALSHPTENLYAVDHAIAALNALNSLANHAELSSIFENYRKALGDIAAGHATDPDAVAALRAFFQTLAEMFYEDVAGAQTGRNEVPFDQTGKFA